MAHDAHHLSQISEAVHTPANASISAARPARFGSKAYTKPFHSEDVHIAPVSRQHRQQNRSHYIPILRRIQTLVSQRAVLHPLVVFSAGFEKLNEECHLPQTAHTCFRHPFQVSGAPSRRTCPGCFPLPSERSSRIVPHPSGESELLSFIANLKQYQLLLRPGVQESTVSLIKANCSANSKAEGSKPGRPVGSPKCMSVIWIGRFLLIGTECGRHGYYRAWALSGPQKIQWTSPITGPCYTSVAGPSLSLRNCACQSASFTR